VDSEVYNTSGRGASVGLSVVVVDHRMRSCARYDAELVDVADNEKRILSASGALRNMRFWSTEDPYLYNVYSILEVNGKVVDVEKTVTGFRKTEFEGGAGSGGVYLNDKFVYLKGFAQRSSNEWAALGEAYPDWLHDYNANLMRECRGNYMRWLVSASSRSVRQVTRNAK
jgi:beta-galactosidase